MYTGPRILKNINPNKLPPQKPPSADSYDVRKIHVNAVGADGSTATLPLLTNPPKMRTYTANTQSKASESMSLQMHQKYWIDYSNMYKALGFSFALFLLFVAIRSNS